MRFNSGDFMVPYNGTSGDGERLESFRGEQIIDVINSTELRAVGVNLREIVPSGGGGK